MGCWVVKVKPSCLEGIGEAETNCVGVAVDFQFVVDEDKTDEGLHRDTDTRVIDGETSGSAITDFVEGGGKQARRVIHNEDEL